ncbi:transketolase [soil metagenome]
MLACRVYKAHMSLDITSLSRAANEARGLAIDAVHASKSGHLGLPLGCAEIAAVLYGHELKHNPDEPRWIGRDYFILSAGHGSMLLYAWLNLSGYDVTIDDIRAFRQLHSKTPGHPEYFETPGVECTTGPLGQGVGNAVGVAVAAKMAAARFNTPEHQIFDQHIICLAGDGCMQEGVSAEACAFAGHFGLDNLILIYDANAVTLDAMAAATQSEDTGKRFQAYGFDVQKVDGQDMAAFLRALKKAKARDNGNPQMIIAQTLIGKGIPDVAGTAKAHGEAGAKFPDEARKNLGLPEEHYFVSQETRDYFAKHKKALLRQYKRWEKMYRDWRAKHPDQAQLLDDAIDKKVPTDLLSKVPAFPADAKLATRKAGSEALQPLAREMPFLISGSADLHGSTLNYIEGGEDFTRDNHNGRNIRFGIREHGMCAIMNGIGYHGIFRASGATFLVFADYCRASIRLAALSKLPNIYIFTHDSIGVGEDGPTHQPVETVSGLRVIPQLDVIRPADPEETAGAFVAAAHRTDGPTLLALTRQAVPTLNEIDANLRREGVARGGYTAKRETGALEVILLSCGSELQHAMAAAAELGAGTRVVSMPCFERFEREPETYREEVLPRECRRRVAIEAGVTDLWFKYVGLEGKVIGLHRFGLSAPGDQVMKEFGIDAQHVVEVARSL